MEEDWQKVLLWRRLLFKSTVQQGAAEGDLYVKETPATWPGTLFKSTVIFDLSDGLEHDAAAEASHKVPSQPGEPS